MESSASTSWGSPASMISLLTESSTERMAHTTRSRPCCSANRVASAVLMTSSTDGSQQRASLLNSIPPAQATHPAGGTVYFLVQVVSFIFTSKGPLCITGLTMTVPFTLGDIPPE